MPVQLNPSREGLGYPPFVRRRAEHAFRTMSARVANRHGACLDMSTYTARCSAAAIFREQGHTRRGRVSRGRDRVISSLLLRLAVCLQGAPAFVMHDNVRGELCFCVCASGPVRCLTLLSQHGTNRRHLAVTTLCGDIWCAVRWSEVGVRAGSCIALQKMPSQHAKERKASPASASYRRHRKHRPNIAGQAPQDALHPSVREPLGSRRSLAGDGVRLVSL